MTIETPRDIIELRESVEALQSRNAFQDDIIEQLNNELAIHQLELSELRSQLKLIARRVQDNVPSQSQSQEVEPPPPHY
jgi:SlyX protein